MNAALARGSSARGLQLALLVGAVVLVVLGVQRLGETSAYWLSAQGAVLGCLCLAPAWTYLRELRRSPETAGPLPLLPVLGLIYAVYFALPVLLVPRPTFMSAAPSVEGLSDALDLATLGWVALLLGVALGRVGRVSCGMFRLDEERARELAWPLVLAGLGCYFARSRGWVPSALEQVVVLGTWLHPLGVGIGLVAVLRGRLRGLSRTSFLVLGLPSLFAVRLGEWGIASLAYVALYLLLVLWATRGSLPWGWVVPGLLAIVVVKGGLSEFRLVIAAAGPTSLSQTERVGLLGEMVGEYVAREGPLGTLEHAGATVRDRTSMIALFAHVVERTPQSVPYWGGSTYRALPAKVVPRALWPDKPEQTLGNTFGHAYGLLAPTDDATAVHCPQVVELYVNFGRVGVLLGMVVIGFLIRLMERAFSVPGADDGTLLVGALLFSRLFRIEMDASAVWGSVLQAGLVIAVVLRLLGARAR